MGGPRGAEWVCGERGSGADTARWLAAAALGGLATGAVLTRYCGAPFESGWRDVCAKDVPHGGESALGALATGGMIQVLWRAAKSGAEAGDEGPRAEGEAASGERENGGRIGWRAAGMGAGDTWLCCRWRRRTPGAEACS